MKKGIIKRTAFTLAEVLITLGIIGIVAQMTIPTLMRNVQEQVYVTSLKKAYTQMNQAFSQLSLDYGCVGDLACTGLFVFNADPDQATLIFGNVLVKYFKVIQNCGNAATSTCMSTKRVFYDGIPSTSTFSFNSALYYKFIIADGMSFAIVSDSSVVPGADCTLSDGESPLDEICADIFVDVNGSKPPNFFGRDVFRFYITNSGVLYPLGGGKQVGKWWNDTTKRCVATSKNGYYCAGRIMEEGWQMTY